EVLEDIALPYHGSVGFEARKVTALCKYVEAVAVDRGGPPRPCALRGTHPRFSRAEHFRPHFLAIRSIERDDHALRASQALEEHAISCDGHRSVAASEPGRRPDSARPGRRPLLQETRLTRDSRAVGTLPSRPVISGANDCRTQ